MFRNIKKFFTSIIGTLPSYKSFIDRGFTPKVFNSEFILYKKLINADVSFHFSLEPFNSKWGSLGDKIPSDGCFVISFHESLGKEESEAFKCELDKIFEKVFIQNDYFFAYNKNLEADSLNIESLIDRILSIRHLKSF